MSMKQDRDFFQTIQKLFATIITVNGVLIYLLLGMYGPVNDIWSLNGFLILAQLSQASLSFFLTSSFKKALV